MKIKLDKGAIMPTRAHETDAGYDLYMPEYERDIVCIYRGQSITVDTGVHFAISNGYMGAIKSRSGLNVKHGITSEGVIDSGYTGSVVVKLYNHGEKPYYLHRGDKISQIVFLPIYTPELEVVDELEDTERGDNGFGSTGR